MFSISPTIMLLVSSPTNPVFASVTNELRRLSSACQSALSQVAANPDANACLSVSSLFATVLSPNASIITPVDNLLKSLCAAAPCSNATLSAVVANVTNGCSAELSMAPSSSTSSATLTALVEQYYPTVRQMVCLSDSGTNCITQTLSSLQTSLGTLSLNSIGTVISNAFKSNLRLPSNVTCTDCVKEAYNVLNQDFPSTGSALSTSLQNQCGSSFTNGSAPSNVVETATKPSTSANPSNSALVQLGASSALGAFALVIGASLLI
ncbi:unnamed protein product [Mycena citricolor]|uniref:Uncharacterized protein n=1 Tax=Mycena citricolor TaxID=2018698 RepID=A0AAD2Q6H3_9AGAR|nr:unnamed protein product [Mycena citricolor]